MVENRIIIEDDYYIPSLCYLVDYAKVNQDWEHKRKASLDWGWDWSAKKDEEKEGMYS